MCPEADYTKDDLQKQLIKQLWDILAKDHLDEETIKDKQDTYYWELDLFDGLGLDSLEFTAFMIGVEEQYNFPIKDEDVEKVRTLEDLAEYLLSGIEINNSRKRK